MLPTGAVLVTIDRTAKTVKSTVLPLPPRYSHLALYGLWAASAFLSPYLIAMAKSINARRRSQDYP
jgi:hypothetical protein